MLSNLNTSTGSSTTHIVTVEDFVFNPARYYHHIRRYYRMAMDGSDRPYFHLRCNNAEVIVGIVDYWELVRRINLLFIHGSSSLLLYPTRCTRWRVGMSGTITVQANCTNGMVSVNVMFDHSGGSFNGFNVLVDGASVGTFSYDASGTTSISVNVLGDGLSPIP